MMRDISHAITRSTLHRSVISMPNSRSEQLRQILSQNPEAKYSMEELSVLEAFDELSLEQRARLRGGEKVGE